MSVLDRLLTANAEWADKLTRDEAGFFETCAKGQQPHSLWIGCADSRVPETATGVKPGEIFVHRNIANQFHAHDDSAQSVLKYSVDVLKVQNVIVVGHSNCGGAAACLSAAQRPDTIIGGRVITVPQLPADAPLNRWLGPLTEHVTTLDLANKPTESALPVVVKENVKMQVENLCKSEVIADAWVAWNEKREGAAEVWVHGWVYDLATGRLEDLKISKGPGSAI